MAKPVTGERTVLPVNGRSGGTGGTLLEVFHQG
jgi:hypothetical protein